SDVRPGTCHSLLEAGVAAPVRRFPLRPDLAVFFWECAAKQPLRFSVAFDAPVLRFSFTIEGKGVSDAENQESVARSRGHYEIRFFPATSGTIALDARQTHRWVDVVLSPSFLGIALANEACGLPNPLLQLVKGEILPIATVSRDMNPEQFVAASQLAQCPYTGAARTLYLKSKTLELLSHVLAEQSPKPCRTRLSSYEIECLRKAREMLTTNLENPPGLRQLAQSVGLNETKLKTGFKVLFGQTVYGYFRAYRVDMGRQRLLESTATVSEVASSVGYTNVSHFCAAFKGRHGVTPYRYRKDNVFFAANQPHCPS
ncbi:MAG: AraC family transcriptional regulator, partial [Proteobacteria bacterium]|nr:AraC family transcriptional regulator [Pseudomonadota bacterium]